MGGRREREREEVSISTNMTERKGEESDPPKDLLPPDLKCLFERVLGLLLDPRDPHRAHLELRVPAAVLLSHGLQKRKTRRQEREVSARARQKGEVESGRYREDRKIED